MDNPGAYDEVAKAIGALVEAFRPRAAIRPPAKFDAPPDTDASLTAVLKMVAEGAVGQSLAHGRLILLNGQVEAGGSIVTNIEQQKALLGPMIEKLLPKGDK